VTHPYDPAVEAEIDAAEQEIAAIADDRMREMALIALERRFGNYLRARLNDEENP
jgi:hypothetical protein